VTQNDPAAPDEAPRVDTAPTGDARVDEALHKLADLADLPLPDHPAVFEHIHGALTGALGTLDTGTDAPPPADRPAAAQDS
jgi:hypothetical protein